MNEIKSATIAFKCTKTTDGFQRGSVYNIIKSDMDGDIIYAYIDKNDKDWILASDNDYEFLNNHFKELKKIIRKSDINRK